MRRNVIFACVLLAGCSAVSGRSAGLGEEESADCSTLDEAACLAREDCSYVTEEGGFPGPISFCTSIEDACIQLVFASDGVCDPACMDLDPDCVAPPVDGGPVATCESLDETDCAGRPDCEYFTDPDGFPGPISFCRALP